jgi:hypothetical protein
MVHQLVIPALEVCAGASLFISAGLLLVGVVELAERVGRRVRPRTRSIHERYQAEQAIRNLKRNAVHQMLEVERAYRQAESDSDVIEGTAVEVRR